MTTRKPYERLLAMALSIVMVLGMTPVTAMAQTTTDTIGEIIEFEALSEETANREVSLGTSLEDLNLPGALNATVRVATSTDAEKPDQDSGEPQFEEKDIPVPVTWASEPSYDGGTADTYTFTAEATGDGYTVSAALPTITVTVLEDSTPPPAKGGEITAFAALAKGIAEQAVSIGTPRSVLVLPKTLAATVDGEEAQVSVTWESTPEYLPGGEGEEPGEYLFTARLGEGYTLADGPRAPEITVITQAAPVMLRGAGELSWETLQTALNEAETGAVIDLSELSTPAESKVYTFMVGDSKTLTLKGSGTQIENVAFVFGANNNITIEDLNIKSAHNHDSNGETDGGEGYSPLHFTGAGNSVTLVGENTVTSGQYDEISPGYGAAVGVPEGAGLTVSTESTGKMTANGGEYGAGIGGGSGEWEIVYEGETPVDVNIISRGDAGTIEISGGTVTANGDGAGIGGGIYGDGGNITISGGVVTANSDGKGAGIGGGIYGDGGNITINGGTVTASGAAYKSGNGAGIGGGRGGNGGTITINGGTVTAKCKGGGGAGIGGGAGGNGGSITINGGMVESNGGSGEGNGAGIGGGNFDVDREEGGEGGTVVITGGSVKATAQDGAEAIGKGEHGTSSGTLKNGAGADVHLNTLTISGAANAPVSNASYGAPAAAYGVTDVKTDGNGKLYFYLPASSGDEAVKITAGGTAYIAQYTRAAEHTNTATMDLSSEGAVISITGLDVTSIENAVTAALESHTSVTVTGSKTGVTSSLTLVIPSGKTVVWQAVYQGSTTWRIINFSGNGTFEVTGNGVVENTGTGNAIFANDENSTIIVSGNGTVKNTASGAAIRTAGSMKVTDNATVSATTGSAIYAEGASSTVTVSGGTVSATTNNAIQATGKSSTVTVSGGIVENEGSYYPSSAIYMSAIPADTTTVNVTVSGNGTVKNTAASDGHAIYTSGSVVIKDTATVSVIKDFAIRTAGVSSAVAVSGGTVSGGTGSAIRAGGANAVVTVSGGTVSGAGKTPGYPVINMSGTPASASAVNVTVSGSGTVKNTATDDGYAIYTNGSVAVMDTATVSSVAGTAVTAITGNITVSGGTVSDATGGAFHSEEGDITVSGGVVFAKTIHYKYGEGGKTPSVTGQGMTIEWLAAQDTYPLRATTHLTVEPTGAQAYWYNNSEGAGGVAYKNGANEGFLPVADVTVEKITLTKDNFAFAISANTYNGNPQGIGAITLKAPHYTSFNATTGGTLTVFYEGTGGTVYTKSQTAPTNAGSYAVTVEIGGGTEYAAASIALGNYTIAKAAAPSITWPTATAITYGQTLADSELSGGSANGSFAWTDSTQVPNAGSPGCPVTFTPSDTDNYDWSGATLTQNVSVTVNKATFTLGDVEISELLSVPPQANGEAAKISTDIAALVASIKLESDALTYTLGTVTGANAGYWDTSYAGASGSGVDGLTYSGINGTAGETATFPITVSGFTNYENVTVNVVVTLIEKTTVTIGGLSIAGSTYNGSAHAGYTGTPTFTEGATAVTPEDTTLTVRYTGTAIGGASYNAATPPTNAGSYTVTVALTNDEAYIGVWSANFTIGKAAQSAPPAPELDGNVTATTVKVQAPSGVSGIVQFACKTGNDAPLDGDWKAPLIFGSLNPNTAYRFYMRYAADINHEASPASPALTVTTHKAVLTGTVSINGTMKYGETLTANTTALTSNPSISDLGTLSYQWRNSDGEAVLGTGATYTVQEGNIGKRIRVTVTAENCEGFLSHTPTTPVAKADGPAAPAVTGSYTGNGSTFTYTVTPIAGAEYQMDGGAWQEENAFAGITPLSSHTFHARMKETATHEVGAAGNTGAVSFVKLNDRSAPTLGYTVSGSFPHKTVTITMVSGAEYKFGTGEWSDTNTCTSAEAEEITLYIRLKETATHHASADSSVTVNTANQNQDAPPAFTLSHAEVDETSYTVTIPTTAGAEYSFDGTNWNDSNSKDGFMPGETVTGYKRMAEREGFNASPAVSASVTLPQFRAKQPIASPNGGAFTSSQSVTLSSATADAKIYYTTNGDTPTIGSTLYTTAINLTATTTIKAIAVKAGMTDSPVLTVTFTKQSGGSGGGDGGGGYTPPSPPTTPEKKPDQPVTATAPVTTTAGANGSASANIPASAITDAIAKAQADARAQGNTANGISVELNVTMPQGATSLTATIPQSALQSLVTSGVSQLEISGAPVSLSLNQRALQSIQSQASGGITISITPATGLSASARAAIGNRPVYHITISYTDKDGKTQNITSLGSGTATLAIPYTPGRNEAAGYLYGVYVDGNGNVTRIPGSVYDANRRSILILSSHFSVYGVGYTAPSAKFTDIGSHWAKDSIDYVVGRGLLSGTSKTTFAPNTAMTRGMLVTALGRLAGVDVKAYTTNSFTDVKADSSFRPYIEWARSKGIVQGVGNGQFAPDRAITREEIAVIFANFAKATGYKLPVTRTAAAFADASSIGSAYKDAVMAMQQAGIMMGETNNRFNPKSNATRAEVSAMLHRYIKLTIDPDTAQGWAKNDDGQYLYYKDGKAFTGTQTIDGAKYFFNADGTLKTGWVKDGGNWRYYSGNKAAVGWLDISDKRYYFTKDGIMVSGKWLQLDGKWYYFYANGSLAKNTKVDGYEVDNNGVRKAK